MATSQAEAALHAGQNVRGVQRSPRSYGKTLMLFVVGYLVWQSLAAATLPRLVGGPRLASARDWQIFLLVVATLGVLAGSVWWFTTQQSPSWWRNWLRSSARMLAVSTMFMAARIGHMPVALWLFVTLTTAAGTGVAFGWMERWDAAPSLQAPPA